MSDQTQKSGFKWQVAAEQEIAAPAQQVWDVISRPGNLELCHPFCTENPVHSWPGPDSRDEVHYLSGWVYERRFSDWLEGTGYDLEIFRGDVAMASVSWRISAVDERHSKLRITVYPFMLRRYPTVIRRLPHLLWLRPRLRTYLESVVRGFEWYITRGEPVLRDQFGTHAWFSARAATT